MYCIKHKLDKSFYKKDRAICKDYRIGKKKRKCNNISETFLVTIVRKNKRTLLVRPRFSGETYFMLKILSRVPVRDIHMITKSPPGQYPNSRSKIEEFSEEFKPLNEDENAILVFDVFLSTSENKYTHQFFIRGRHFNLDIYYLPQTYFDLPKRSTKK